MRKSVFVASALMLALSGAAFAQGAGGGTGGAGGMGGGAGAGGSSIGERALEAGDAPTLRAEWVPLTARGKPARHPAATARPVKSGRRNEHGRGKLGGRHRAQHQDPLNRARGVSHKAASPARSVMPIAPAIASTSLARCSAAIGSSQPP